MQGMFHLMMECLLRLVALGTFASDHSLKHCSLSIVSSTPGPSFNSHDRLDEAIHRRNPSRRGDQTMDRL